MIYFCLTCDCAVAYLVYRLGLQLFNDNIRIIYAYMQSVQYHKKEPRDLCLFVRIPNLIIRISDRRAQGISLAADGCTYLYA